MNDVVLLVKEAIIQELTHRGFNSSETPSVFINVDLRRFYNDFQLGFWSATGVSDAILDVQVQKPDQTLRFSKQIIGKGIHEPVYLSLGYNAKPALEKALQDAVTQLFNDPVFMHALLE